MILTGEIGIFWREESDFHHPEGLKIGPGAIFKKSAGWPATPKMTLRGGYPYITIVTMVRPASRYCLRLPSRHGQPNATRFG